MTFLLQHETLFTLTR